MGEVQHASKPYCDYQDPYTNRAKAARIWSTTHRRPTWLLGFRGYTPAEFEANVDAFCSRSNLPFQ